MPLNDSNGNDAFAQQITGAARLKGVALKAAPDEVYETARRALAAKTGDPGNFKSWYVLVDDRKVAPKWLVSQLSGLPVSSFDAGAARRVLRRPGVPVHRHK